MGRSENSINHQTLVSLYSDLVDHSDLCVSWNSVQSQCPLVPKRSDYFIFSQCTVSLLKRFEVPLVKSGERFSVYILMVYQCHFSGGYGLPFT